MIVQTPPSGFFPPQFFEKHPFDGVVQSFLDSIRVFDVVFGGVLLVMLAFLMWHSRMLGRKIISLGMLFLVISVVGTEFEAIGTQLTYRLVINTVGLLVVAGGIWITYLRSEP